MKKILFINGHMNMGGVERSLTDLLRNIDYSQYSVDLLLLQDKGDYLPELPEKVNVVLKDISLTDGKFLKCIWQSLIHRNKYSLAMRLHMALPKLFTLKNMARLFGSNKKYDAAIAYRPGVCADILESCIDARKKIIWWHHGDTNIVNSFKNSFLRQVSKADALVSVSEIMKEKLCRELLIEPEKICVIPNIVDSLGVKRKEELPHESLRRENCVNILSVGRMSKEKNYIICPEICRELLNDNFSVNWIMIGSGYEESAVIKKAEELGVSGSFRFEGDKVNPYVYYNDADVFVHTSLVESQCISVLEAMALGVPSVVVKSAGPSEYIKSGQNGYLTENEPAAVAKAVKELVLNSEKRDCIVLEAYKTAETYRPEKITGKFYKLME